MATEEQISKTLNQFSYKLYNLLAKDKNENFFISPYSISTALSMCYFGAQNETATQLRKLLHLETLNDQEILELNKTYISHLNDLGKDISLNTANKIYPLIGFNVKQEFIDSLGKNFFAEVQELDFSKNKESAKTINDWVSQKTVNKVNDLIDPSLLDADTRLVLVNAIYFKGNWLNRFDSAQTYKEDFHLGDGTTQKVDMMKLLDKKFVFKMNPCGLRARTCEFPYIGKRIAMTIILPHDNITLNDLESQLNMENLGEVLSHVPVDGKVFVYIPKFKVEYKSELSDELIKLGVTKPFDENEAEFSKITDNWRKLCISKVIHQAVVEVNEEGTEAAAASAVVMMKRMAIREFPPEEFKCNRPFLFIIHDKLHGGILFMGKYTKPL